MPTRRRSEEHTSELQSHRDLHSFPTRRSSDLDERVIDGLINSLAFDPSVNVRLNALNALYAHSDQEVVRAGVLACLPRETNPLVQVSMIDFLVGSKAREARPELTKLSADEKADTDVRDSARRAIDLL